MQMCEQAAEAHKSKGAIHSSRRNRMSSDPSQLRKSSIDAILDNNSSSPLSQVYIPSAHCPIFIPLFLLRCTFCFSVHENVLYGYARNKFTPWQLLKMLPGGFPCL